MRQYEPANIRNIALVGHGGAGKTMLAEALLYASGATTRMGKIEDGTAATDYEPEEHKHQISVSLGMAPIEWNGFKINIIDCPGQPDFVGDVVSALRVADAVVFVLSAVDGVEVQHELIWDIVEDLGLPRLIVINKMDRERASFQNTLSQLQQAFGTKPFPLHVPIGEEHDFKGVVDLLKMTSLNYDQKSPKGSSGELPSEIQSQVDEMRGRVVEAAAEGDDALLEKYLEEGDLDEKEIATGLSGAVASGATAPVLVSSATHLIGIDLIADEICALVPSPLERPDAVGVSKLGAEDDVTRKPSPGEPLSAYVFKSISDPYVGKVSLFRVISGSMRPDHHVLNTRGDDERVAQVFYMSGKEHVNAPEIVCGDIGAVAKLAHTHTGDTLSEPKSPIVYPPVEFPEPVLSIALAPKSHGDEDKLMAAISRLVEEDPVLRVERRAETHQTVASGLGEAHLGVVMERMKRKFGVEVEQLQLRIPYRETIRGSAQYESRYIKQSGGRGQYAVASLQVDAQPEGAGYEFVNKISGGAVPQNFIPSVDKGVQGALSEGVLAGYPVVDVKVTLFDGKFHTVDSSDMAFQICGSIGFKEACKLAQPTLLEPWVDAEIKVPEGMLGDIMGDINAKRGRVLGTEPDRRGYMLVRAQAPQAEMARYAIDLRSITGGRATFSLTPSHYEDVPQHIQQHVIDDAENQKAAAKA
ncbi:MAG: elongation factor G [Actinomycetota bacterium]